MKGCKNCPAHDKCTVTYRGSSCAALRWTYGIDSDPEITTNADRIRAMSDEELAKWLEYPICKYSKCTEECPVFPQNKDKSCKENILNYLRQPPEEKGGLPF